LTSGLHLGDKNEAGNRRTLANMEIRYVDLRYRQAGGIWISVGEPRFARAVQDARLIFVEPSPHAIALMDDKTATRADFLIVAHHDMPD
jgi:biotin carboxylase